MTPLPVGGDGPDGLVEPDDGLSGASDRYRSRPTATGWEALSQGRSDRLILPGHGRVHGASGNPEYRYGAQSSLLRMTHRPLPT